MAKKPRNPLDFAKPLGHLCPHENSENTQKPDRCLDDIEVKLRYSDKPADPGVRYSIERMLVRWLTRAYTRKYGKREEEDE